MGRLLKFKPREKSSTPTPPKTDPAVVLEIAAKIKGVFTQEEIDQIKKELTDESET